MKAYFLCQEDKELKDFAQKLGYKEAFFSKDFVIIKSQEKKEILKLARKTKKVGAKVIIQVHSEELLRYVIEKVHCQGVFGMEYINKKDSMHYPRTGVDQVIAKLAHKHEKKFFFNVNDLQKLLSQRKKARSLRRISYILKFTKKYRVQTEFVTFARTKEDLVSVEEIKSLREVLQKS